MANPEKILSLLSVDHKSELPIYLQLMDGIKNLIYSGDLAPGIQLPTVRALATALDINPNTAARAYRELEQQGHLSSRIGRGTFIAKSSKKDDTEIMSLKLEKLALELRNRCLETGITEQEFLNHIKERTRRH